jgi:(4S)-4-hydroxy-5-phosphonooxypentane-2,3-dione isomerase
MRSIQGSKWQDQERSGSSLKGDAMFVVSVTIFVKAGFEAGFVAATLDNARGTRKEAGNVRFDVLRAEEDGSRFLLYEVYLTKEDFARHQQTGHYLKWKETVAEWMREPRQGVKCQSVFFGEQEG